MRLKDKVAIITGAGAGLGRASALLFAEEGAKVVIADRDPARASSVEHEITDRGGVALGLEVDVADEAQVRAMTDRTIAEYAKLDILFCNAGIGAPRSNFLDQTAADWRRVFDVNVIGMLLCIQQAVPHLRANGGGVILNCSSGAALVGIPGERQGSLGGEEIEERAQGALRRLQLRLLVRERARRSRQLSLP